MCCSAYPAGLDAVGVVKQLPADTNEQLAKLIAQIVCHHLPAWREELIDTQVSGPRVRQHMQFHCIKLSTNTCSSVTDRQPERTLAENSALAFVLIRLTFYLFSHTSARIRTHSCWIWIGESTSKQLQTNYPGWQCQRAWWSFKCRYCACVTLWSYAHAQLHA